jgi:hypothetical protein
MSVKLEVKFRVYVEDGVIHNVELPDFLFDDLIDDLNNKKFIHLHDQGIYINSEKIVSIEYDYVTYESEK